MKISTNGTNKYRAGLYAAQLSMTSGTVEASISLEGLPTVSFSDLTRSSSTYIPTIFLPECELTFALTGDAQVSIQPIER